MKRGKSTRSPNKAERLHFIRVRELGCVACRRDGRPTMAEVELHHVLNGYRIGHHAVLPLCRWHHQGIPPRHDLTVGESLAQFGPSLGKHKRAFVERYGSEQSLLDEVDRRLNEMKTA